jgi:predicted metal-dependent phosphoesterase TrpH
MKKLIDLHTHTTASDGTYTPSELVRYAKTIGLSLIAITDHDTISGIEEALYESKNVGIEILPGVEISVSDEIEIHMLSYFKEDNYKDVDIMLEPLRLERETRNVKVIDKLNELGYHCTVEEAKKISRGDILARPHIARLMLNKGYVKSIDEAFEKFIGEGKKAFFPKARITAKEAITKVVELGGLPVLAHPVHLKLQNDELEKLLEKLISFGLVGMEVFYADNSNDYTGYLSRLAVKYGLVSTGGSDFHGTNRGRTDLGVGKGNLRIDYRNYEDLAKRFKTELY